MLIYSFSFYHEPGGYQSEPRQIRPCPHRAHSIQLGAEHEISDGTIVHVVSVRYEEII